MYAPIDIPGPPLPIPRLRDGSHHAVVIVGGGPAGCATAIGIASFGLKDVVVIEARRPARWRVGEALPPAASDVLQRLGLWEDFLSQDHLPSAGSCASWGHPDLRYNDFLLDMQGKGWHLDRAAFDAMLRAAVVARGGTVVGGMRLRQAERCAAGGYVLSFESDEGGGARARVTADFLVDATGIAAGAARRLGVARNQVDCVAVICTVVDLNEPDAVPSQTLLEACAYGWWYAARVPQGRMVAALAVDPSHHRRFGAIDAWLPALCATHHIARWLESGKAALADYGPELEPPVTDSCQPEPAVADSPELNVAIADSPKLHAVADGPKLDPPLVDGSKLETAMVDGSKRETGLADGPKLETALAPSAILSRVVGERWLAVGDAASAYDPIAAQGIVKALCDGEAAAAAIASFFAGAGEQPLLAYQDGVFARFRDYLRLRQHLYALERRWPQSPFWRNRLHPP